jgi:hypothetical protein
VVDAVEVIKVLAGAVGFGSELLKQNITERRRKTKKNI